MPNRNPPAVRLIAHRGLFGRETENTCASFIAAAHRPCFAIETDVRLTADNVFVVSHDNNLQRISGVDITIEDNTLETLQNVVYYDLNGEKSRSDLRLCTLDNYLGICRRYQKHCALELKAYFTSEQLEALVQKINEYDYLDKVVFSSFHYDDLVKLRRILLNAKIQLLVKELHEDTLPNILAAHFDIAISSKIVTEELVTLFHQNGCEVLVWVVNDQDTAARLAAWGVDYITTNTLL